MTKQEFLIDLQKALTNRLNSATVNDHVNYYREYIEVEIRKGREETEVIEELGDPRLIAKSILTAAAAEAEDAENTARGEDTAGGDGKSAQHILAKIPLWLWIVIIFLIVVIAGVLLTSVVWKLLPVLFPVLLVVFIVKWWNNNR